MPERSAIVNCSPKAVVSGISFNTRAVVMGFSAVALGLHGVLLRLPIIRNCSGPEVSFEEIAIDLFKARFWANQ